MAELIAQGRKASEKWRRVLPPAEAVVLGREAGEWSVPWEPVLSRRHALLTLKGGRLSVEQLPEARNAIFLDGETAERFQLASGRYFVVGSTTFEFIDELAATEPASGLVVRQRAFSPRELKKVKVQDAALHINVLSRLPQVIAGAADERELYAGLVNLLLAGVPRANGAALVAVEVTGNPTPTMHVLHWDRRLHQPAPFRPSDRLVAESIEAQETKLNVWAGKPTTDYTQDSDLDWAFCTPVRHESQHKWGIYVAGKFNTELAKSVLEENDTAALMDDIKFTELLAEIWGSLQYMRHLEQRQNSLNRFIPRTVLSKLGTADVNQALKPQQAEVTVMFTDLRGFSGAAESRAEALLVLLEQVSELHGIVTRNIVEQEGVIGDFQGDGVMSFWGWPNPQPDIALRACRAALRIQAQFKDLASRSANPLAQSGVGIGMASGTAVAGLIGSADQVKASVFGHVVNLAARIEGMTRLFRVPILLDETTSQMVQSQVPREVARLRRLAKVQPYGMNTVLTITELLPPLAEDPLVSDEDLASYDQALREFSEGHWTQAFELLHRLPANDFGKDFLTSVILQNRRTPPPDWRGYIALSAKA